MVSSSPGCVIERNLMVGNKEGFDFREQRRTAPRIEQKPGAAEEAIWNHDEVIRQNVFAYNRDAQVWGWFDVRDQRHWPKSMQTGDGSEGHSDLRPGDSARVDAAKPKEGLTAHPTLESLNIVFADDVYAFHEQEGLFHWGTAWLPHRYYANLDEVRGELKLEQGGVVVTPLVFTDYLTRNFGVPADCAALKLAAYPQGTVPGVQLSVVPSR